MLECKNGCCPTVTADTLRIEDDNDYEYEIGLQFFLRIGKPNCTFLTKELAMLSLWKKVDPSPDCKMMKLLTLDELFPPLQHSC